MVTIRQLEVLRTIRRTSLRFLSMLLILFLGVALYLGLQAAGPSLLLSSRVFMEAYHLADGKVQSTAGWSNQLIEQVNQLTGIEQVLALKVLDGQIQESSTPLRVYQQPADENYFFKAVEGRLPEVSGEIALDAQLQATTDLRLGQQVELKNLGLAGLDLDKAETPHLKEQSYTLVGWLESPLYLSRLDRGRRVDGQGSLNAYATINEADLQAERYSELYYWQTDLRDLPFLSQEYRKQAIKRQEKFEELMEDLRIQEAADLMEGRRQAIKAQQPQITDKEIAELLKEAHELVYYYIPLIDQAGYGLVENNAEKLFRLSRIFPLLLFLLAILIISVTMARMVQEDVIYLGTMMQLAYSRWSILTKYLLYGGLASVLGATLGAYVGLKYLPQTLLAAYQTLHYFDHPLIAIDKAQIMGVFGLSLFITLLPAIYLPLRKMNQQPVELLQGNFKSSSKARGSKTFRIRWMIRSMRRNWGRSLLTFFAISSSTLLMLAGLALSDSLIGTVDRQFEDIMTYTSMINCSDQADLSVLQQYFESQDAINSAVGVQLENLRLVGPDQADQELQLIVPMEENASLEWPTLLDAQGQQLGFDPGKIYLSQVAARDFGTKGSVQVENNQCETYSLAIDQVFENYVGHYLYLSPEKYESIFGQPAGINAFMLTYPSDQKEGVEADLGQFDQVDGLVNLESLKDKAVESMKSLNLITLVLILVAAALTFVILLNLLNMQLDERLQEIAMMKVVGMFDYEVSFQLFAETYLLAFGGIVVGLGLGRALATYMVQVLSRADLAFVSLVRWQSVAYSSLLVLVFLLMISLIMHRNIQRIPMAEVLKGLD